MARRFAHYAKGVAASVLAALTLAACATYSPPTSGPTATVTLVKSGLNERQQAKVLYRGPDRSQRVDMNSSMLFAYDVPYVVKAGERLNLETETTTFASQYLEVYCSVYFSFEPVAGRAYTLKPTSPPFPDRSCAIEVIDTATGRAADGLRIDARPVG